MIRLRTFLFILITLVVGIAIGWVALQTKAVLASGFADLESKQLERVTKNIQAIIKSKRDYLDNFMPLVVQDKALNEIFTLSSMTRDWIPLHQKLNSMRKVGKFDLVDVVLPGGAGIILTNRTENLHLFEVAQRSTDRFVLVEIDGHPAVARVEHLSRGKREALLVLGYALTEAVEKRISELTGTAVRFLVRPKNDPALSQNEFVMYESGDTVLVGSIKLDRRVFNSINAALGTHLLTVSVVCLLIIALIIFLGVELGFAREFRGLANEMNEATIKLEAGELPSVRSKSSRLLETNIIQTSFSEFASALGHYAERAQLETKRAAEAEKEAALGLQAKQFAHDIRSPLNALDMVLKSLKGLKNSDQSILRQCASRVHEVADSILSRRVAEQGKENCHPNPTSVLDLVPLIQAVVEEKKVQYREKTNVDIIFEVSGVDGAIAALVNGSEFKRILSNLMDNSVDAVEHTNGFVKVSIERNGEDEIAVRVSDNGKGMAHGVLSKVGEKGFSHGKPSGSGLGLYSAKQKIATWGGQLSIQSIPGAYTEVTIELPAHNFPKGRLSKVV